MEFIRREVGIDVRVGKYQLSNWNNNSINRYRTMCCALGQLSLNDDNTIEQIETILENIKLESSMPINCGSRDGAERAIFVVTLPKEKVLEENLTKLGFQMIYEFHRRACYNEEDMLKLWIISW